MSTVSRVFFFLNLLLNLSVLPAQSQAGLPNGTPAIKTSDGVALFVKVAGRGYPCVFVHGGPGAGSYAVEALAGQPLEKKLQMIYLDQRGSGRSASDPSQNYSLDRQVQDLEELRQQLGLTQWLLMSHSFGGIIATAYAAKYPARVQGLILVNSILNLPATMESTTTYGYTLLPAATRPPLDPAAPLPQRWGMVMSLLNQQKLLNKLMYVSDSMAARVTQVMRGAPANRDFGTAIFQSSAITAYVQDFTPASARLTMPVLVLSGREDYVTGPEHYKSFRFPNQRALVLPGKHYTLLENPQEFHQALSAFIRKLPAKTKGAAGQ